ncbi:MAG TPA: acyl-CoA carboxylase subunit epsilon [Jatrophihabitantaceae bacterium]|nr:acyl-CoA carboxylase subunit epsilon [Jatrophihabitantaceae bacterium]
MTTDDVARPSLRIVRGEPTPEELAVVTALLTAAASGPDDTGSRKRRGRWADPFDQHRRPWQTGAGGWRAALRP